MKKQTDSELPVQTFGLQVDFHHFATPNAPHRHNEIEMVLVKGGTVKFLFGGTMYRVQPGQSAVFWAVVPHLAYECEPGAELGWAKIPMREFLEWRMPDAMVQGLIKGQFLWDSVTRSNLPMVAQFERWRDYVRLDDDAARKIVLLEMEARLREIALNLSGKLSGETQHRGRRAKGEMSHVEAMIGFIAGHYRDPLSIDDIADAESLKSGYAMRLFKDKIGMSILTYVYQHRIAHAQRLLITTDSNVLDILLDSGFGSVTQFYTMFKRYCGCTPLEYREMH